MLVRVYIVKNLKIVAVLALVLESKNRLLVHKLKYSDEACPVFLDGIFQNSPSYDFSSKVVGCEIPVIPDAFRSCDKDNLQISTLQSIGTCRLAFEPQEGFLRCLGHI